MSGDREGAGGAGGPLSADQLTADSPFTLPGFFDELAEGRLVAARCTDCGTHLLPPRPACYDCGSRAVELAEQPRTGHVVSYTAAYRPPPAFADLAPVTLAVVELDSGARLTGRVDADLSAVEVDSPVELRVRDPGELGVDPEAFLSYEADWPLHEFVLR
ncbi:MAG: Zn-ribbon domain-containing OB-fold protein [Halosimplex sp.]